MAVRDRDTRRRPRLEPGPAVMEFDRSRPDVAAVSSTPLSLGQEELWYLSQLAGGDPVHNESVTILREGQLELEPLRHALSELVCRHEIWRSTFRLVDGEPRRVVQPPTPLELPLVDLSGHPPAKAEAGAARIAAEAARQPYELERGPLVRPLLVRLAPDRHHLYLGLHQLVFDSSSLARVIFPELIFLYEGLAAGSPASQRPEAVQYSTYAAWERAFAEGEEGGRRLDYWRRRLTDMPAVGLPLDHPRAAWHSSRAGAEPIRVSASGAASLRTLSGQGGGVLFHTVAAAFAVLLNRYSGEDDVVFSTVANLRPAPEFANVVGYAVTPLVIRSDLGDDPSFLELVRRVRRDVDEARANMIPFGRVVRALNQQHLLGANPIFQAALIWEPPSDPVPSGWELELAGAAVADAIGHAEFDLVVELEERRDGAIAGRLVFNTDLFERATAQRMVGQLETLLDEVGPNADRPLTQLSLMSGPDRERQLVEWNATESDFPRDACLHELIAAQVRRDPTAAAVIDGESRLSYAELDERAGRLAGQLRRLGVGPDVLVGVYLDRSAELVVAVLAVLKAGGAYVPLEPEQPAERLALMVGDARPAVILTAARLRVGLPSLGLPVVAVDEADPSWSGPDGSEARAAQPTDLAYVMYTSGSTGRPKGVMVEHRNIVNQLTWLVNTLGIGPADRVLLKTPFGFDPSVFQIFCPLICGAALVVLEPGAHADPQRTAAAIRRERITVASFVPTMLQAFLDSGAAAGCTSLRHVTAGGEPLSDTVVQRFFESFGTDVELRNIYGPTETTVNSTSWRCEPGGGRPVPIGRPIANTQIYLLDRQLGPVPQGVPGELCIGGAGVARGYLNLPGLTAERFVANPFRPGERLYRTGDRARYRRDGTIEYLGRTDQQVKIRGNRIELGEVEAALAAHPEVSHAAVAALPDARGDLELVGFVVVAPSGRPVPDGLRHFLQERLPAAMIPSAFVGVEVLPATASGKLDRAALAGLGANRRQRSSTFAPPVSELHRRLAGVWEMVLGVRPIGLDQDFFELGGHSLLAVRLLTEVDRALGVQLPLSAMLTVPFTVAGMASVIEARRGDGVAALEPAAGAASLPRLFFIHPDRASLLSLRHFKAPLAAEQEVVGVVPERVGARMDPNRTVREVAADLVRAIRASQPHGPYQLAGFSFGGLLAYEVAAQLIAARQEVSWLGVLDSGTPALSKRAQWIHSKRRFFPRLVESGPRRLVGRVFEIVGYGVAVPLARLRLVPPPVRDDFDWRTALRLAADHQCRPVSVPLELFVTAGSVEKMRSASLGWADVHPGPIIVHGFPGEHLAMITEPNVRPVVEAMRASLRRVPRAARLE